MTDEKNTLAAAAYETGRKAADCYLLEGRRYPPSCGASYSLTQWLKGSGDTPTEEEMATVKENWERGVDEAWRESRLAVGS